MGHVKTQCPINQCLHLNRFPHTELNNSLIQKNVLQHFFPLSIDKQATIFVSRLQIHRYRRKNKKPTPFRNKRMQFSSHRSLILHFFTPLWRHVFIGTFHSSKPVFFIFYHLYCNRADKVPKKKDTYIRRRNRRNVYRPGRKKISHAIARENLLFHSICFTSHGSYRGALPTA